MNTPLASGLRTVSLSGMRTQIFVTGLLILLIGIAGPAFLPKMPAFEFLRGGMTLGGALIICGIFMIRMYWHGLIGAGVVSLIGAGKGVMEIKATADFLAGNRERGIAPLVELGITVICLILLFRIVGILKAERTRRMLEAGH